MKLIRQKSALERLRIQLKSGKVGPKMDQPMSDKHRARIESEIKTLEARVGNR